MTGTINFSQLAPGTPDPNDPFPFWSTADAVSKRTTLAEIWATLMQTVNTITIVPVTDSSALLIAANPNRKFLKWMVTGANPVTVTTANPAVFGQGDVYAEGGSLPSQGGVQQYDSIVPTNAYYAICAAGQSSELSVEEGV